MLQWGWGLPKAPPAPLSPWSNGNLHKTTWLAWSLVNTGLQAWDIWRVDEVDSFFKISADIVNHFQWTLINSRSIYSWQKAPLPPIVIVVFVACCTHFHFVLVPQWYECTQTPTQTHLLHHDCGSMTNSERPREAAKAKGHASSMKKDTSSSRTGNTVTDISPIWRDRWWDKRACLCETGKKEDINSQTVISVPLHVQMTNNS